MAVKSTVFRASEALAKALCEIAFEHVVILRPSDGAVLAVSRSLHSLLGWGEGDLIGRPDGLRRLFGEGAEFQRLYQEFRGTRVIADKEVALKSRAGESVRLHVSARLTDCEDDVIVVMTAPKDGSQEIFASQKAVARAAEVAASELNTVLLAVGDGVITTDGHGRVLTLNPVAEQITGWRTREARGLPLREVFRVIRTGRVSQVPDPISAVLNRRQTVASWPRALLTARDGTEYEIAESVSGLRRPDGDGFGVLVVFRDVTTQTKLERELQKTQRLEALGVLASGIAHDLNNVLTSVFANLGVTRERTNDESLKTRLRNAERTIMTARLMTRRFFTLSQGKDLSLETTTVSALVEDAVAIALSGSSARADVALGKDPLEVHVDAPQMSRVIQNLVLNATQAMPEGGTVTVRAEAIEFEGAPVVRILISDTGPGIPRELRGRIFEPYFTTKSTGSGLGLAVAQSIVAKHHGSLDFTSTPSGTTFEVVLPRVTGDAEPVEIDTTELATFTAGEAGPMLRDCRARVLFLEDDAGVADATLDMLEQMGCATVHVQSGEEAVAVFERARAVDSQAQPFDVLLIDLTVRGATGGRACLGKLRKSGCAATAVLTSGYAHLVDVATWRDDGFDAVLPKPYSLDELRHTLEMSIEEPADQSSARSGT